MKKIQNKANYLFVVSISLFILSLASSLFFQTKATTVNKTSKSNDVYPMFVLRDEYNGYNHSKAFGYVYKIDGKIIVLTTEDKIVTVTDDYNIVQE